MIRESESVLTRSESVRRTWSAGCDDCVGGCHVSWQGLGASGGLHFPFLQDGTDKRMGVVLDGIKDLSLEHWLYLG